MRISAQLLKYGDNNREVRLNAVILEMLAKLKIESLLKYQYSTRKKYHARDGKQGSIAYLDTIRLIAGVCYEN